MTTTARVSDHRQRGRLELELDYDETDPPSDVFFRLTREGWHVPTPGPPDMIDLTALEASEGRAGARVTGVVAQAPLAGSDSARVIRSYERRVASELISILEVCGFRRADDLTWLRGDRTVLTVDVDPPDVEAVAALLRERHGSSILDMSVVEEFGPDGEHRATQLEVVTGNDEADLVNDTIQRMSRYLVVVPVAGMGQPRAAEPA